MDEDIKILCVDDEQNVLNALKRLFLDENYTLLTAPSGPEGLKVLDQEHAQIIISDYRMPGMNGVEFLKEACARWPHTVRIVLSGYADTAAVVSSINEGQIYKFIPKPWNDDELKVTVSNAIERYFLYKKNAELTSELQKKNEELEALNEELKSALEYKSVNLEFSNKALASYQDIIDAIPIGIIGIDPNNMVVMCNSTWIKSTNNVPGLLGSSVEAVFSGDQMSFIEEVKKKQKGAIGGVLNGNKGKFLGALMRHGNGEEGVILLFIREDDIS